MKRICLICVLLFCVNWMFAEESDNSYWTYEAEINGELVSYYCVKTDEQFDNLLPYLVEKYDNTVYAYDLLNYTTMKNSFVSLEYIVEKSPVFLLGCKFFRLSFDELFPVNIKKYKYTLLIDTFKDYVYVYIMKYTNEKLYFSLTTIDTSMAFLGVRRVFYTKEAFDIVNSYFEKEDE